ncbi:MAG TPA: hypothetical protein VHE33_11080 [Acidobacteriaceae bacterium]|nr:hypothetical protein [Acidobacteriaceae bacterium]
MRFFVCSAAVAGACLLFAQSGFSQDPSTQVESSQPESPRGQVLFSGQPAQPGNTAAVDAGGAAAVSDAERRSVAVTAWNLEVHLSPREQAMEVHARVTLRNAGAAPLNRVALQLSSTLHFETVGFRGKKLVFRQHEIASDADHTGKLNEAVIPLEDALPPDSSTTLDVDYGGTVPLTAERLTAIGAPDATAQASDWDRITEDFTGVRGFGNVVWYPVSSVPVSLKNGSELFNEIGRQKQMDEGAIVSLRLTDEFVSPVPNAVVLNGHLMSGVQPAAMPTASFPGVLTASLPATRLGFETPSFFVARRTAVEGHGLRVLATDADAASAQRYVAAAEPAEPVVTTWLGKAKTSFTILDLPEADDAPAEMADVLATPLSGDDAQHLTPVAIHALAHGAFQSPRVWLNEGVAAFLGSLWIEQSVGQQAALEGLNAGRPALALAEPASPGEGSGEDLLHATSAVYYRTKADYVLWMLRDVVGDQALQSALQQYDPAQDTTPEYFEKLLEKASSRDLKWFFDDWVYRDRGLPDLSIGGVYPSREGLHQVLVAVEIRNDGYAAAEVPVTLKGLGGTVTRRVLVPAHGRITHRMTFSEDPVEVDVNDGSVPEVRDSVHARMITAAKPH